MFKNICKMFKTLFARISEMSSSLLHGKRPNEDGSKYLNGNDNEDSLMNSAKHCEAQN